MPVGCHDDTSEEFRVKVGISTTAALRRADGVVVGVFVAGCAERMAQFFTGLRGDDPARPVPSTRFSSPSTLVRIACRVMLKMRCAARTLL